MWMLLNNASLLINLDSMSAFVNILIVSSAKINMESKTIQINYITKKSFFQHIIVI